MYDNIGLISWLQEYFYNPFKGLHATNANEVKEKEENINNKNKNNGKSISVTKFLMIMFPATELPLRNFSHEAAFINLY